jgi:protein disulfide-isomerase A1
MKKFIKEILTTFLLFILINIIYIKEIKSSTLQNLRIDNFDEIIEKTEYVFILYYKPNSDKSEEAKYQFELSALKINKKNIAFGTIEKNEENENENSEQYEKIGNKNEYPKLILFYKGFPIPYENSLLTENINLFIDIKTNSSEIKKFTNFEDVKNFRTRKETVFYIGENNPIEENYLNYLRIAKYYDDIIFCECPSQDCMENYESFSGIISIHNGFSNETFNLDKFNANQLSKFVRENTNNIFTSLNKEAADTIFNKYSAGVFLFYNNEDLSQKKFIFPFTKASKNLKYSIHIVIAEFQSQMGIQVAEILKLEKDECPKVYIIDSRKEEIQLYKLNKEINEENIYNFVLDWGLKKLNPIFFSEEIPEIQTYPIMTLVGKNYNEIVIDSPNDFLVYYMKPNCKPCIIFEKKLKKIVNKILKEYGNRNNFLKFGKINGELNDIEKVAILNYPAINYYKKENKIKPVKYEINDFEIINIIKFITENNMDINYDKILNGMDLSEDDIINNENDYNIDLKENLKEEKDAKVEINYIKNDI